MAILNLLFARATWLAKKIMSSRCILDELYKIMVTLAVPFAKAISH